MKLTPGTAPHQATPGLWEDWAELWGHGNSLCWIFQMLVNALAHHHAFSCCRSQLKRHKLKHAATERD